MPRWSEDRDLPIEPIELGEDHSATRHQGPERLRGSWSVIALGASVVVAIAVAVALSFGRHNPTARLQALPPFGHGALPETIHLVHPVLAVPTSWELIARGPQLERIDLRTGVIVRTEVPPLQSSGPSFSATR